MLSMHELNLYSSIKNLQLVEEYSLDNVPGYNFLTFTRQQVWVSRHEIEGEIATCTQRGAEESNVKAQGIPLT